MSPYVLSELGYDYSALEPHIAGKMLELHHQKHHGAHVKNANTTLEKLDEARGKEDFTRLVALEKALAFNLSSHVLHSIFWRNLAPKAGGRPEGELARALERDFGGFDQFRRRMTDVASTILGSGWAALVWEPLGERLLIMQIYDHQSYLNQSGIPIMVLDAWEHAYYLQYQNRKTEFFDAVWNLWNWADVSTRLATKRSIWRSLPERDRRSNPNSRKEGLLVDETER